MRRVAITGIGIVSPVGNSTDAFFRNLLAGTSGIRRIVAPYTDRLAVKVAGQVEFDAQAHFSKIKLASIDRFSQFALLAAKEAMQDAGLPLTDAEKLGAGVYLGTGLGGAHALEAAYSEVFKVEGEPRIKPFTVILTMNNAAAGQIALEHGLQGPNQTFSTACASSAIAIGEAFRTIRHGYADAMLAGGAEALLTFGTIKSWEALRVLAFEDQTDPSASCRPFSKDRSGLVLGEGAAVLVLEEMDRARARGAVIYAEVAGYGIANDAAHITKPAAHGQARAMSAALSDARMPAEDIDYINAHGTATLV
ncbi:MAG: beta-ketoacyl-[acyl-carrier-protein] synthase family protein, partial [Betaproteobacteria bacterium]